MRHKQKLVILTILAVAALVAVEAQHQQPKLKPMTPEMRRKLFGDAAPKPAEPKQFPVPTPEEQVIQVPEDAVRTESGLAYRVLDFGEGNISPRPNDKVTVHFTGWNGRGAIFDDTRRTKPRTFQVNKASAKLAEGLQLMVAGAKFQFWGEESLVEGQASQLMRYEVELIAIDPAPAPPAHLKEASPQAKRARSGLLYEVLQKGRGTIYPAPEDLATIHFSGWTADGVLLSDTFGQEEPMSIKVGESFHVFDEAVQEMVVGERRRVWVNRVDLDGVDGPATFDIELVSLLNKPTTPLNVAAPPEDAVDGGYGLYYQVLQSGTGEDRPGDGQTVVVHYATWKRNGELLDSNFERGKPVGVALDGSMPQGWNLALQQMTVGEKRRIWIPEELSFPDGPGRKPVPLVFEVELVAIVE